MKTHTNSFKEQIKEMGRELDSIITYGDTVLGNEQLNAVTPSFQGGLLKSVMKQLDIDSNVAIPIGTILRYEFGLKVNGEYEYINYGNYVVYSVEKQEDTNSYKIVCYDKLLYSMLDYVKLPITYPISIRDYINAVSTALGLTFANRSGIFANYDKQIQADLYDGLGYTFRDVLDELAQVTASTICLNNNDELEIRYITETGDTIDEEFLKDVNVNFGEKFGAVNTIVLSRSGDSDSVYHPPVLPANPYEIKISDNQIMNGNDRTDFLPDIYNKLNGLEFYTNDFVSTGICYYDLCDRYSVKVGDTTYSCVMFNDEVLVTQGLEENIYTELPEQTETDYKHASKDDRMINQVYIIAKKNEAEILALVSTTEDIQKEINPIKDESGSEIIIEDASNNPLTYLEIEGKSTQATNTDPVSPSPEFPSEIESVGTYNNETGKYGIEVEATNGTDTNTSLIVLNAPLRSLPNGVKDIAYIRNNKLYVDRKIGSVVLDGSENWVSETVLNNTIRYRIPTSYFPNCLGQSYTKHTISNRFTFLVNYNSDTSHYYIGDTNSFFFMPKTLVSTLDAFKTWLSTHNTEVIYELATPVTEELGEIEMLKTLKGYNDILTTDELLPIINLTYVRDTILADYVENHVAELKLTEKEIKTSVETVSSSVDGLNTSINRVEEITNDNSQVINIISTNIDKTSGEVREVTTTTGFTFNADGMTIDDGSGFRAEHTAKGTYYKDGTSVVGQYTKDGSKQKDLELFGTYSYGKESIDDTPMFVGQLYRDENGEECFGHFYNGGNY